MEGDLQELADNSAKKDYLLDDDGNVIQPDKELEKREEPETDELEETKQAADNLEDDFEVPTRLKNMRKADIAKSYLHLEREKSRLGNELGDLRKQVDELLKAPPIERKPIDTEQLLDNPDEALNSAISENEKLKQLEERLNQFQSSSVQSAFYNKHPDADDIAQSAEFQDYLNSQPIAAKAAALAAQSNDYSMLGDVLDSFKSFQGHTLKEQSKQKREAKLKDAQMESGSTGGSSRKVYKRSDLVNMRIREPEKYAANEAEYMKAYSEGRVK